VLEPSFVSSLTLKVLLVTNPEDICAGAFLCFDPKTSSDSFSQDVCDRLSEDSSKRISRSSALISSCIINRMKISEPEQQDITLKFAELAEKGLENHKRFMSRYSGNLEMLRFNN
jgi:hypothetical protein